MQWTIRNPHSRRRRAISLAAAIAFVGVLSGCAGGPADAEIDAMVGDRPGRALVSLALRQDRRPSAEAMQAPAPPGVDESLLTPVDPDDAKAIHPLDAALEDLLAEQSDASRGTPADEPDLSADPEALRLYVSGRQRRLSGNPGQAIRDLEAAARRDPDAAAPWRELGEAYVASNDRFSALAAFRRALERNPTDFRSLEMVGRTLVDRRQPREAAPLLARAWRRLDGRDPALPHIIGMALGRTLHQLGYLHAGNEAMRIALDLPDRFGEATIYSGALSEVYRAKGDAWRDVGDADIRLGRFEEALEAYKNAASQPSLDPGAVTLRRVYASMRVGRPAEAALIVLGELKRAEGRVEDRDLRLIEYIAEHSSVGSALAEGIEEVADELTPQTRALAASRLARARAAALPDDRARAILRERLAESPQDDAALTDLFARLSDASPGALLSETIRLVDEAPYNVTEIAEALRRSTRSIVSLLEAHPSLNDRLRRRAPARMLRAALLSTIGRRDEAGAALSALVEERAAFAPARVQLAHLREAQGRTDEALEFVEGLDEQSDDDLRIAKARLLHSLGRPERALATIEPMLEGAVRGEVALLAADLYASLRQWEMAEQWRRRAVGTDPTLEAGYRGLIELYAQSGPLSDSTRLNETIRSLRRAIPSSRTLRWLRAAEMTRSGQFDQAERDLLSLAEEEPTESVVELLVTLWVRTNSTDRAERWLREAIETHGERPVLVRQLGRALGEGGRAQEGVSILRDWLARRPADAQAARLLENLLRDKLGRIDEADALAIDRLDRAPDSMRRSLELAEIHMRQGDSQQAADVVEDALRLAEELDGSEREVLTRAVLGIGAEAGEGRLDPRRALDVYQRAAERLEALSIEFHATRLALIAAADGGAEEAIAAADLAAEEHSRQTVEIYLTAVQQMVSEQRLAQGLTIARSAVQERGLDDPRLGRLWVQLATLNLNEQAVREALTTLARRGMTTEIASEWLSRRFTDRDEATAELAVVMAGRFASEGRDDAADRLYRLALSHDPRHPMANNNLGYRMLELHRDVADAEKMLEIAYAEDSNNAAIVDSLGWLRYKQGVYEDVVDDNGRPETLGSITLLEQAATIADREAARAADRSPDPVIYDHLGDALWRAGRVEEAKQRWTVVRSLIQTALLRMDRPSPELRDLLTAVERKIAAVARGDRPEVAPTLSELDQVDEDANPAESGGEAGQTNNEGAPL